MQNKHLLPSPHSLDAYSQQQRKTLSSLDWLLYFSFQNVCLHSLDRKKPMQQSLQMTPNSIFVGVIVLLFMFYSFWTGIVLQAQNMLCALFHEKAFIPIAPFARRVGIFFRYKYISLHSLDRKSYSMQQSHLMSHTSAYYAY